LNIIGKGNCNRVLISGLLPGIGNDRTAKMDCAEKNKKFCCEELRFVIELEIEFSGHADSYPRDGDVTQVFDEFLNLRACPFCGAPLLRDSPNAIDGILT